MKNIKNEDFGFEIFVKGKILRPFSGLATSEFKGRLYVHREIV